MSQFVTGLRNTHSKPRCKHLEVLLSRNYDITFQSFANKRLRTVTVASQLRDVIGDVTDSTRADCSGDGLMRRRRVPDATRSCLVVLSRCHRPCGRVQRRAVDIADSVVAYRHTLKLVQNTL